MVIDLGKLDALLSKQEGSSAAAGDAAPQARGREREPTHAHGSNKKAAAAGGAHAAQAGAQAERHAAAPMYRRQAQYAYKQP